MKPYRVLVTGSREGVDQTTVFEVLNDIVLELTEEGTEVVIVHGACPKGADRHARDYVRLMAPYFIHTRGVAIRQERHPADWDKGKGAGFARNTKMAKLGAEVCVAFIAPCTKERCPEGPEPHGTHGATHCAGEASDAGIRVIRIPC